MLYKNLNELLLRRQSTTYALKRVQMGYSLQVTFVAITTVTGFVTQGQAAESGDYWVTKYMVRYLVHRDNSEAYVLDESDANMVRLTYFRFKTNFISENNVRMFNLSSRVAFSQLRISARTLMIEKDRRTSPNSQLI